MSLVNTDWLVKNLKKVNLNLSKRVATKSSLLKNYCPAEEYHQKYLEKK